MKKMIYLSLLFSLCSCANSIEGRIEYLLQDKAFIETNKNLEIIDLNKVEPYMDMKEGDYVSIEWNKIIYNKEKTEKLKEEVKQLQLNQRR